MKKFFMMAFVSLFAVVALSSCDKDKDKDEKNDDDGGTNGMVITANFGSSYNGQIDTVKALIVTGEDETRNYEFVGYEVATSPYTNGGFTLNLPSTVNSSYLEELEGYFESDLSNVTISASNVKLRWTAILAYKSGRETGEFYHGTPDWDGSLMYVSADVNVTGYGYADEVNSDERTSYSLSLKKGWNMIYLKRTDKGNGRYDREITTTAPTGAKWYYDPYDYLPEEPSNPQGVVVNNTITATVENGSSYSWNIETVKALVVTGEEHDPETGYYFVGYEAATSPYTNGGFTLNLPSTINSSYLEGLEDEMDMSNITVSASNVKHRWTAILAYKSGKETGHFYHGTSDWEGELIYVSTDVTITGYEDGHSGRTSYNLHFKRGWNMIYEKQTYRGNSEYDIETTTEVPAGAKWYFVASEPSNPQGVVGEKAPRLFIR